MNNRKSLILSVVGVVVAAIGLFLPWYDNTQAAMNGIQIASDSGAVFVVLCYLLLAASLVLAIVIKPAQSKWAKLFQPIPARYNWAMQFLVRVSS